jgi:endonuclease III related protein
VEAGAATPADHRLAAARLRAIYRALDGAYDYGEWHWAAEREPEPFAIIAGAVLVQHTTWTNAERALDQLRAAGALDPHALATMPRERIAELVRVSGTPAVKARRLSAIARTIDDAGGLDALFTLPTAELRTRLLATHGIGPETADAVLLYAAGRPVFEVDAYTQRLFGRIGMGPAGARYDAWQRWFEDALPAADLEELRRWHAYIVLHGKRVCRPRPRCGACTLVPMCNEGQRRRASGAEAAG